MGCSAILALYGSVDASADRVLRDTLPDFVETGAVPESRRRILLPSGRFAFVSKPVFKSSSVCRGASTGLPELFAPKESCVGIRIKRSPAVSGHRVSRAVSRSVGSCKDNAQCESEKALHLSTTKVQSFSK